MKIETAKQSAIDLLTCIMMLVTLVTITTVQPTQEGFPQAASGEHRQA